MKPTKQLIRALRETAQLIRTQPERYDWARGSRCNCGLLAQNLMGISESVLFHSMSWSCWTFGAIQYHCSNTGLPMNDIFKALHEAGLEQGDYDRIEHLGGNRYDMENPSAVAAWMDREADKLERLRATAK